MNVNAVKHHAKLLEWKDRVADCRSSGMSVKHWCEENTIGVRAFGTNIKQVSLPDSVTAINPLAFDYTNMQDIHCSDPIWDLLWESVKDSTPDEKERFCICFTKNACNTAGLHEDIKDYISKKRGASCIIVDGPAPLNVQNAAHRF